MTNAIPPIMVQIAADVSQLKAGLAQAQASIKGMDSTVQTANTGMQNMMATAKRMAGTIGVAFAATQVVQFGKDVIMAASSMNESISKVKVVFGQGADEVLKFGDTAAKSMGLSNQAAIEAAGTYGNLFQAFGVGQAKAQDMSTNLVQLAADLASFNNTSTEDAINALRSGLSGETEPLKRFGVALNEVTLKNKAFEMGFGTIKGAMDPAIKAQVTYALVMEQTKLAQGDYERTASGTANTMKTLAAQFADAKVAIGDLVLPAFNALLKVTGAIIPIIKSVATYFKENSDAIKMFAIILGTAVAGFYTFKAVMIATKTAMVVYTAVTKAMAAGHSLAAIATLNLRGAFMMLNLAMKANPIGFIITGLVALGAAFVFAWNKSEKFRTVVVDGVKIILKWWAFLIEGVGKFIGILGKIPGMGWAKGISDGAQKAADSIRKTADELDRLKTKTVALGKNPIASGTYLNKGGVDGITPTASASSAAEKEKKRAADIKANQKKLETEYKDLAKLEEKKAKLITDYEKDVAERKEKYNEDVLKAQESANKRLIELEKSYNKQIAEAQKDAARKRQDIIQQSLDGLRNVFKSASALDVGKMFADLLKGEDPTKANAGTLVDRFKQQLSEVKTLAANATALSNKGFSQTFIEQVVSQGTDVGNKLAEEILKATPETVGQLQSLFTEIQDTSAHGVDLLATTMYEKLGLATEQLKENYAQVGVDLNTSLIQYAADFAEATTQVKADLVETLASLQKDLNKDLAEMQDSFHVAMAEINKDIQSVISSINQLLALMAALGTVGGAAGGGGGGGGGGSIKASNVVSSNFNPGSFRLAEAKSMINVNISNTNTQSDAQTAASVLTAIKYGQVIELTGRR
jgi:hypothetical protein